MKAAIYTLGCKVNQTESEYMAELLSKAGFEIVSPNEDADFYIINSCTVTATADQKTRQNVRKFKRKHPDSVVILTGCMPQAFPKEAEELIQADIVLGNKNDGDILELINQYNINKSRVIAIDNHKTGDEFRECSITKFSERVRAFVKIEDGCDRFCSYCIIPMSRGRVRSKSLKDLKNGRRSEWHRINKGFIEPTLKDCVAGDLALVLPHRIITNILEGLETLNKIIPGVSNDDTLLYGPEIKFFSNEIETDNNFKLETDNIYFVGDGAGKAGNIVTAAATGLVAARDILERMK